MAKKKQWGWVYSPKSLPKPKVPKAIKDEVEKKGVDLIETVLKPQHVKSPPKNPRWNYVADIGRKWHGSFFYFFSTYRCPGPNALRPTFESKFARLEYTSGGRFNLAYMRHTDQWWELFTGLTLDECLERVKDDPLFQP